MKVTTSISGFLANSLLPNFSCTLVYSVIQDDFGVKKMGNTRIHSSWELPSARPRASPNKLHLGPSRLLNTRSFDTVIPYLTLLYLPLQVMKSNINTTNYKYIVNTLYLNLPMLFLEERWAGSYSHFKTTSVPQLHLVLLAVSTLDWRVTRCMFNYNTGLWLQATYYVIWLIPYYKHENIDHS